MPTSCGTVIARAGNTGGELMLQLSSCIRRGARFCAIGALTFGAGCGVVVSHDATSDSAGSVSAAGSGGAGGATAGSGSAGGATAGSGSGGAGGAKGAGLPL